MIRTVLKHGVRSRGHGSCRSYSYTGATPAAAATAVASGSSSSTNGTGGTGFVGALGAATVAVATAATAMVRTTSGGPGLHVKKHSLDLDSPLPVDTIVLYFSPRCASLFLLAQQQQQ